MGTYYHTLLLPHRQPLIHPPPPSIHSYTKENQAVGITGEVDFVGVEGISIIVRLKNRFWHDRKMVLARVSKYITDRIPEAMVEIENINQLEGQGDDEKSVKDFYAH